MTITKDPTQIRFRKTKDGVNVVCGPADTLAAAVNAHEQVTVCRRDGHVRHLIIDHLGAPFEEDGVLKAYGYLHPDDRGNDIPEKAEEAPKEIASAGDNLPTPLGVSFPSREGFKAPLGELNALRNASSRELFRQALGGFIVLLAGLTILLGRGISRTIRAGAASLRRLGTSSLPQGDDLPEDYPEEDPYSARAGATAAKLRHRVGTHMMLGRMVDMDETVQYPDEEPF